MKKLISALLFVSFVSISACDAQPEQPKEEVNAFYNKYGLYDAEYINEYAIDSEDPGLQYFLVFTEVDGNLVGYYYGCSDDFDFEREGYLPGYFVKKMENLKITDGKIEFDISVEYSDFHINPISRNIKQTSQIDISINPKWDVKPRSNRRHYSGAIIDDQLIFEYEIGYQGSVIRKFVVN